MDYRFKPISNVCATTGDPLVPGEVCYSVLFDRDGVYERQDFSRQGWTGIPEGAVGYWKCLVPFPETRQAATVDPETLLQYFEQLQENPNPRQEKLSYVLALHLLQKRRLKLEESRTVDDVESLVLTGSRGEGPYEIRDQQLTQAEISELQADLNQQLTLEWNAA